jgi:hypothetical protein
MATTRSANAEDNATPWARESVTAVGKASSRLGNIGSGTGSVRSHLPTSRFLIEEPTFATWLQMLTIA